MKFTKPDESTVKRMTPRSIQILIDTLKAKRDEVAEPFNEQIKFYEDLKRKKEEAQDAEATS